MQEEGQESIGAYLHILDICQKEDPIQKEDQVPTEETIQGRGRGSTKQWCPRQESNLRTRIRNPMLYPLSYGGGYLFVLFYNQFLAGKYFASFA